MEQASLKRKIKYFCLSCDKGFDRLQRLQAHQSKSSCRTNCIRCEQKFRTRTQLSKHQKNAVHKSCDICNLNFCRLIDYYHHQKDAHGINPNKCTTCSKEFGRYQELEQHQKNAVHNDCTLCDRKFCRLVDYRQHQKDAHGIDPNRCTICLKEFRRHQELERHQNNAVHNDCALCDRKFCRLVDYQQHQKDAHGIIPNKCTICLKKFRRYQELERHQKNAVHTDCELCDRKFCSERDYKYHQIADHHINPRKCKTCGKEHKHFSDLKKHLLKAVPQACDLCDQTLCTLSDYNRHRITVHHGGEIEPEDTKYQKILDEPIFAPTGMEEHVEYKAVVKENYSEIRDKIEDKPGVYGVINRELAPGFTFRELRDQLVESLLKHGRCAKFNIGFGFLLQHKLTDEFRYYYVSTNTMLFKKAHTISKRKDIKDIIRIIHDMNVGEHYYLMRPNSSWIVAGISNMKFKLFYMHPVLG